MDAPSPTVLKRYVGLELRRLRESAGFKRDEVARRAGCVTSHITHLEVARNLPKVPELELLLTFYGAADRIPAFLELLEAARSGSDWWLPFAGAVPGWFDLFLGLESCAETIASFNPLVIPTLFQTPEYAEDVVRTGEPDLTPDEVMRCVELRMARQDVLTRQPDPPLVSTVLDESVLHRPAVDDLVLAEQLSHLLKLAELPTVTIRVLPLASGVHAGVSGTFVLLTFPAMLWAVGQPSSTPEIRTYFRLAEDDNPDAATIALAVDAKPPASFSLGILAPITTIELTLHLRAQPAPGWLTIRATTRRIADGWADEDVDVWDSTGQLVAHSRQLMRLIKPKA